MTATTVPFAISHVPSPPAHLPVPWLKSRARLVRQLPPDERNRVILVGTLDLFAYQMARCFNLLTPEAKTDAIKIAATLGQLRRTLQT